MEGDSKPGPGVCGPGEEHANSPDQGSHLHNTHRTGKAAEQRPRNSNFGLLETVAKTRSPGTLACDFDVTPPPTPLYTLTPPFATHFTLSLTRSVLSSTFLYLLHAPMKTTILIFSRNVSFKIIKKVLLLELRTAILSCSFLKVGDVVVPVNHFL